MTRSEIINEITETFVHNIRVYIADIVQYFGVHGVSMADVHAALHQMARPVTTGPRALVLYQLDNPQERTARIEKTAMANSAGFPLHVAYIK